jgi:hypothetical protein
MPTIRVDTHAHLYPHYPLKAWCDAAHRNLGVSDEQVGAVFIVDRAGQDSFARFRTDGVAFGVWREFAIDSGESLSEEGSFEWDGKKLSILRGVQYVSLERIEVLGLGVGRSLSDGAPAAELIDGIGQEGGVACLPWSPGKWLGKRGAVISKLMRHTAPERLTFGDIVLRSSWGPYSPLLARAKKSGFTVLLGTDPLPRDGDSVLVGSFGVELSVDGVLSQGQQVLELIQTRFLEGNNLRTWGTRNSPVMAFSRFISTL